MSSTRRQSTRRGVLIGFVIGFGSALILALSALPLLGEPSEEAHPDHEIAIDGEHVAVELTVPGDLAIDEVAANPGNGADPDCRGIRYDFVSDLTIEAFASDCAVDATQRIINGRHGTYRTLEDVPDPVDVDDVSTRAGPAQVFVQHYSEHTNVSESWDEPIAIVTLDDPVDAEFPTLVLRSDKAALSRDAFTEIVTSLGPIDRRSG